MTDEAKVIITHMEEIMDKLIATEQRQNLLEDKINHMKMDIQAIIENLKELM